MSFPSLTALQPHGKSKKSLVIVLLAAAVSLLFVTQTNVIGYRIPHLDAPHSSRQEYHERSSIIPQKGSHVTELQACVVNKSASASGRTVISIANQTVPRYLPDFKNPCWIDEVGNGRGSLTCMPYAYLVGFPKSGTSDLHARIVAHPLVARPRNKEPHYLTRLMYTEGHCRHATSTSKMNISCPISRYATNFFSGAATMIWKNFKFVEEDLRGLEAEWMKVRRQAAKQIKHPMITLDSSASTAWDFTNWRKIAENAGCEEPQVFTSDLIVKLNPNIKIIILMRDPVTRAYSDYVYFNRRKATVDKFHNLAVSYIGAFNECMKNHSLLKCIEKTRKEEKLRLYIGMYHVYISQWLQRLPREQILFVHSETYKEDVVGQLQRVYDFLGLPRLSQRAMRTIAQMKERLVNSRKTKLGPMYPETERLLKEFYAEHNRILADLLDDQRFLWQTNEDS